MENNIFFVLTVNSTKIFGKYWKVGPFIMIFKEMIHVWISSDFF